MVAVSEILLIAKKSGCDVKLVKNALMGGFANSRILDLHGDRMIKKNYKPGFKSRLHLKDLKIATSLANNLGLKLKNARYSQKLVQEAVTNKLHEKDSSVINEIIKKNNK